MTATRKTAKPAAAEASKTASFEYKGHTFTVPTDRLDVPMEVVFAETEYEIVEILVGPDQWTEFRATRPTIRDFQTFAELVFKTAGFEDDDAGN
jgi:hypothetical protein